VEMAFRSEAKISEARITACVILAAALLVPARAAAQQGEWQVRHQHLRNGAMGTLRVTADSISFDERDKKGRVTPHSRQWKYDDIQQLTLSTKTLRILTYEDQRWQLGRDREFVFDHLPEAMVSELYGAWRDRLDARFVAAMADDQTHPDWQLPVKLLHGRSGSQGVLGFGADRIVYQTAQGEESRTWRLSDLENVSSSGAFDLTLTAHEGEFRFQLKQGLTEQQYDRLWRQISRLNGLSMLKGN
jgi:alpha-beta hydrolase superfamily lysophospholipase